MDNRTDGKMIETKKKPSRLRMFLNFWGGICLNAFAESSGASKAILAPLKGTSNLYAITAGLLALGILTAGYFMSSLLMKKIDSIALPIKTKTFIQGTLIVIYLIGAIMLATLIGPVFTKAEQISQLSAVQMIQQKIAPVITMSTLQDSEGHTEAEFNLESLKNLEELIVESALQKSRAANAEAGNDPAQFNPVPVSSSIFTNVGGKKLGIIKITIYPSQTVHQNAVKMVNIVGFTQRGFEKVACIRCSNHDIPIWSGECGNKVKEVFGISMQP